MFTHALNEGVGDPAIKLFGTTIAVPLVLMRSGDGLSDTRPGSPQKLSPIREGILSAAKDETENDLKVVYTEASVSIKETDVQQSMGLSTSKCLLGVVGSFTDNVAPIPFRKKKQVLDPQCMVEFQERSCRRPGRAVPCPRCESCDTKFCYNNNYNVNQPRHFCKNCQRYWTAGGTLRNVPVGAGRRKNKNGLSTMQRHFVLEGGPVRADAPDAALPCSELPAIGAKPSVPSSELYLQCAKRLEAFPSKPAMWSENAVPIAGEVGRETGVGKHVCTDDYFALQWRSHLGSASNPLRGLTCVPTVRCNSTFSAYPSVISDWTATSRFSGAWPHGYAVDWSRDMSVLGGKKVPPSPTKLIGVPSTRCQEGSESIWRGTWGTVNWLNVWCVPEWPVRRASNCNPFPMSPLGKHLRDVKSAESRDGGGLWAPKAHKTEDLGSCCRSFMGLAPKLGMEPQTTSTSMAFLEDGLGGKTRHANPAAMTRSMVFQEFN